jgi:tetratricopeptide (TPR) repeat protein
MTYILISDFAGLLIRVLIAIALFTTVGCGSRQTLPQGPPVDRDLENSNRAARAAFESGRIQQAANLYRQALERAYLRDDLAAIVDARYNLAVCLTLLQSNQEALELVNKTREEFALAGQPVPHDILLLEATILYRLNKSQKAWQLTEEVLKGIDTRSTAVQSKTHFLRGLIANDRGDLMQLREEIAALAQSNLPVIQADREELFGYLFLAEHRWDEAVLAFDGAAALRRQILDYRGMVKALAKAGEACERAGRLVQASRRYLRAGQSAALQGNPNQAQIWLTRAVQLAEQGGDENILQEARLQLVQLQKYQPESAAENDPAGNGLR